MSAGTPRPALIIWISANVGRRPTGGKRRDLPGQRAVAVVWALLLTISLAPSPATVVPAVEVTSSAATLYVDDDWASLPAGTAVTIGATALTLGRDAFA